MQATKIITSKDKIEPKIFDHIITLSPAPKTKEKVTDTLPKTWRSQVKGYLEVLTKDWQDDKPSTFHVTPALTFTVVTLKPQPSTFARLNLARKIVATYANARKALIDISTLSSEEQLLWVDALISAHEVRFSYQRPCYKTEKKKTHKVALHLLTSENEDAKATEKKARITATATNLVRELAETPVSHLGCKELRERAKDIAKAANAQYVFWDRKKLAEESAGAFLAVARGSEHNDSGIVKITYKPQGSQKHPHLILVGKGVVYDTGGVNLKPASYMFGMHGDMAGSALALALFGAITTLKLPLRVSCYLAITDNVIDAKSYRPNEVITTVTGKTIETVHTDAEGRMMLVDTLGLAAREDYDFIINFATLTGSCVRAIGTTYAGVFSNQPELHDKLIAAGTTSGERVWPFPMDDDFLEPLKSEIADFKQCLLVGGVDHIEAAQLLKQFVRKDRPWVHVDMSAMENTGGLAHVPEKVTGFGVRFALELIESLLDLK